MGKPWHDDDWDPDDELDCVRETHFKPTPWWQLSIELGLILGMCLAGLFGMFKLFVYVFGN